jgi:endonuclease-8
MPEGDTIHRAANRIGSVLAGRVPDEILTPHPRFGAARWPQRLSGRRVEAVTAHGKHLFIHWQGGLVVHSHLGMTGAWGVYRPGQRWRRAARRAWLVMRADDQQVVEFDGPLLELVTESRTRFDQRIAALGPDILGSSWGHAEERRFVRRLREADPMRPFGDALLDQHVVAGIGNMWKCEGCFEVALDPWRATRDVTDEEALATVRATRPLMERSVVDGHLARPNAVYGKAGRPCPRCGAPIVRRGQGDGNRPTYWCPECQS